MIGSLGEGTGDRWSDLDLGFGVAEAFAAAEVLRDWTQIVAREFHAVNLFDVAAGSTIYRVFLFPGCLQVDLSFAPESEFGARGPKFKLLFGRAVEGTRAAPPTAQDLLGMGVHHAIRARFCIERGRYWQAQHWIGAVRDSLLGLACRRHGLEDRQGRGYDELPAELLARCEGTLVRSVRKDDLLRALGSAVDGLLREADEARELAARVEPELRALKSRTLGP